jgi:hypothetical protein
VTEHDHTNHDDSQIAALPWSQRLRSKAGWSDAASYAMADIKMLRKELLPRPLRS